MNHTYPLSPKKQTQHFIENLNFQGENYCQKKSVSYTYHSKKEGRWISKTVKVKYHVRELRYYDTELIFKGAGDVALCSRFWFQSLTVKEENI